MLGQALLFGCISHSSLLHSQVAASQANLVGHL